VTNGFSTPRTNNRKKHDEVHLTYDDGTIAQRIIATNNDPPLPKSSL
jgi:hypothetical protein